MKQTLISYLFGAALSSSGRRVEERRPFPNLVQGRSARIKNRYCNLYQTASEIIRAGLRRLKEDQDVRLPKAPKTLEELEAQLLQGIGRLDRGEGIDGEQVFRRLRKRIKETRANG